jgi:uncharacterized protein (DUF488 family)
MPTTIFTIGHGRAAFANVAGVLRRHKVATIIDVRSVPYSQHAPDFAKEELIALATASGLAYRWMGDSLGGRPEDPELLNADGEPDYQRIDESARFRAGIVNLTALADSGAVALLCSEERPEACHRSLLIAPVLTALGYRVVHLRHDGTAQPHQDSLEI